MRLAVVGTGYVGLVSGMCLASLGHHVSFIDRDDILVGKLRRGISPIYEAGLDQLMEKARLSNRAQFHSSFEDAVPDAELVFLCVGTPMDLETGEADLSALRSALAGFAPHLSDGTTLILKSTVPVGTNAMVSRLLAELRPDITLHVASNPEFLREGTAVDDFLNADRIVCGVRGETTKAQLVELYANWPNKLTQLVITTPENAELSKYASNAFLALKITFINEIANLCERVGADVEDVAAIVGMDGRIGDKFLRAGPGYGGSCFPKDTAALAATAGKAGAPTRLIEATIAINEDRKRALADRVLEAVSDTHAPRIAILGITFKANTDDVRDSPGIAIVEQLQAAGAEIAIYDPIGIENAKKLFDGIDWADDALTATRDADAVVVLTEWDEFQALDLHALALAMRGRHLFDLRNILDRKKAVQAGLAYFGVGRTETGPEVAMSVARAQVSSLSRAL